MRQHPDATGDVIAQDAERICRQVRLDGLSGARILVTGASGLIGTYLLGSLAALQHAGGALDVHAQVFSDPLPHLSSIVEGAGFTLVRADLGNFADYDRLPEADVIVHAAGYAQPLRFMARPGNTLQIGAAATLALLHRLRPGGHFLFLSSAQVYTGLHGQPCHESQVGTTTPAHPRASYIEGKRAGEAACHAFRGAGVHATAARLGDVYGPGTRSNDQRALNAFIAQALTQGEIRMLDKGSAVRTYCYVADAVVLLWRVLLEGRETLYNVGGQSVVSIAELAAAIGRLTGTQVIAGPAGEGVAGAPDILRLDLTRIASEFGLPVFTGLDEGLSATIAWQRGRYHG